MHRPALRTVIAVACCCACQRAPERAVPDTPAALPPRPSETPLPDARDSTATLTALRERAAAIDADTAAMTRVATEVPLGAGAVGTLVGWRAGPVWRRVEFRSTGTGFATRDIYWLHHGVFLGAALELQRTDRRATKDDIWFRDGRLYRWTDRDGRRLNAAARSTQYEVAQMSARRDSLLARLTALDAVRAAPQ
jgi:hypothetical protein